MALLDAELWGGRINVGGWTDSTGLVRDVVEPATGKVLGSAGIASRNDVLRAATLAEDVQRDWAASRPEECAAVLRRAGQLWEEHAAEVQDWIVREPGSSARPRRWR